MTGGTLQQRTGSGATATVTPHTHGARTQIEPAVQRCAVRSRSGDHLTEGRAVLLPRGEAVEARVTELTEPGALLNAYVGKG